MAVRPIEDSLETDKDKEILYSDDTPDEKDESNDSDGEDEEGTGESTEEEEGTEDSDTSEEEDDGGEDEEDTTDEDEKLDEKVGAPFSGRPTYRQVIDEYPKLFKKFPGVRNVFFRERDFSRIYQ